ncbi:BT4734/BF3469 family protein [Flavobacterium sp.]|uniref:BT4734/BF3469 family protein n=1 Tax=Flavobacterium sp. TaxID=239 RepID=UPI0040349416
MFQLTQYASAKEPKVQSHINLTEVLEIIKNGDENLSLIQSARAFGKGNPKYDTIKTTLLPTFRFNFLFDGSAANDRITAPTGLIYLDADNVDTIPDSPYILARWKSLSDTGFAILIKVTGLTLDSYKDTYNHLSELIGITSDAGARKATQQTIQSYDPNLYYNPDALVYECTESKKVSHAPIKKREKCIGTNETFYNENDGTIRFNNIDDYFTGEYADGDYRVFDVKEWICNPYIIRIEEGNRNKTIFFLLSQYALLNPNVGRGWLKAIADTINSKMYPNLSGREISLVIDSVLKKREAGSLELYRNDERRVLFNPKALLTQKEKMNIVNRELGKRKSDFTKKVIYQVLENWNFEADGKITQEKVAKFAERGESTVKRHWADFKAYSKDLNDSYHKPTNAMDKAIEAEAVPNAIQSFKLDDQVNLYELLPVLSFSVQESMVIIDGLNRAKVSMKELVTYIGHQRKEQQYNDYSGVPITPEQVNLLRNIIAA